MQSLIFLKTHFSIIERNIKSKSMHVLKMSIINYYDNKGKNLDWYLFIFFETKIENVEIFVVVVL